MVHCGHEPTAVDYTFSGVPGLWATVKAMVFSTYANPQAKRALKEEAKKLHGPRAHLVQLGLATDVTSTATEGVAGGVAVGVAEGAAVCSGSSSSGR